MNRLNLCFLTLLTVFLSFMVLSVNAHPVDSATAEIVGRNFLAHQWNRTGNMSMTYAGRYVDAQGTSVCHVFNIPDHQGFVLVSSDDVSMPVLGYALKGTGQVQQIPAPVSAWLDEYGRQIRQGIVAETEGRERDSKVQAMWAQLLDNTYTPVRTRSVAPLVTTTWSQGYPYNLMCPVYNGDYVPVGCVALAMGQLMRYYQHPQHGVGQHSYEHNLSSMGYADLGRISANFATANYQYAAMPNQLDADSYYQQIEQVGQLLYHCGISVNMMYAETHSSASLNVIADALNAYFGYTKGTLRYKISFSDAQWISMLKTELDAGRPVLYRGQGSSGGHAFLCAGYDSQDYFYFNWGWGGDYDGYFTLSALNPSTYDFSSLQAAVFGVQPDPCYPYFNASLNGNTTLDHAGLSTTLTASGGVSYQWSTGENTASISVSPTLPTRYTVTVTNASGCQRVLSKWVTFADACSLTFEMHDSNGNGWEGNSIVVLHQNEPIDTVTLSMLEGFEGVAEVPVVSGDLSLKWLQGFNGNECYFTVQGRNFQYSGSGPMANGVFSNTVMRCTADWDVEDHSPDEQFVLYPNPTSGQVWMDRLMPDAEIRVCDMYGRCLMTTREPSVDMHPFAPGLYLFEIRCNGQASIVRKVIRK